jgi:hypothetical protein
MREIAPQEVFEGIELWYNRQPWDKMRTNTENDNTYTLGCLFNTGSIRKCER